MKLKDEFVAALAGVCDQASGMQREDGRFAHPDSGYSVLNQYAGYYFAFLFACPHERNPYFGDERLLERAVAGWNFYRTQMTEDGLTQIYTMNQYWNKTLDEWGIYYWMQTIELLRSRLSEEQIGQWNESIDAAMRTMVAEVRQTSASESYRRLLAANSVANHFVWKVLCCYRYGSLRGDAELTAWARGEMELIVSFQTESGIWLESHTPVVRYADVTICAVSLFAHYDRNGRAEETVRRNLAFVLSATYPNLSKNDCLDGRNRYTEAISAYTALTFHRYAQGRSYLLAWIRGVRSLNDTAHSIGRRLQGLAVLTDLTALLPDDIEVRPDEENAWRQTSSVRFGDLKASIVRENGWVATLCGLEQRTFGNRWILERQNLLSLYHEDGGILVGGGHSIAQPELSSFTVASAGKLHYLPGAGRLTDDGRGLVLEYAGRTCTIAVVGIRDGAVTVRYAVQGLTATERACVQIPLPRVRGAAVRCGERQWTPGEAALSCDIEAGREFRYKHFDWTLNRDAMFGYPHMPFNSYTQKQRKSLDEAFAVLRVELNADAAELELTIVRCPGDPLDGGPHT